MYYVISDIHGHYDEFRRMLEIIEFNDSDTLYVLGDCIDKGDKSIETLLYVLNCRNMYFIPGNHEYMMYQYLKSVNEGRYSDMMIYGRQWLDYNFGRATYDEYLKLDDDRAKFIYESICKSPLCINDVVVSDRHFYLTHSCPYINKDETVSINSLGSDKKVEDMVWNRAVAPVDERIVIYGHTINRDEKIHFNDNNTIGIDCGCAAGLSMGVLRLDDMQEFYIRLDNSRHKSM